MVTANCRVPAQAGGENGVYPLVCRRGPGIIAFRGIRVREECLAGRDHSSRPRASRMPQSGVRAARHALRNAWRGAAMAAVDVTLAGRRDWPLANPWFWMTASLLTCATAL